jgi:hypothetical protein
MSRVFTDYDLLTWEAFASTGEFGLPDQPKIVFLCLTDPGRRARYVRFDGDSVAAQRTVQQVPEADLVLLWQESSELS